MSDESSRMSDVPALDSLGRELQHAADQSAGVRRRWAAPAVGAAVAASLIVAASVFTAPGRALAEQLGELVGIGDEPTQPRQPATTGSDYPAVVIGVGQAPGGERFEIVASGPRAVDAEAAVDRGAIAVDRGAIACIFVELPTVDTTEAGSCMTEESQAGLAETGIAPISLLGNPTLSPTRLIVQGLVLPEVARVEVRYESPAGTPQTSDVTLASLDAELGARIGVDEQAGYFVAFLPEELVPPAQVVQYGENPPPGVPFIRPTPSIEDAEAALAEIEVVAYDGGGEEIARRSLDEGPSSRTLYGPAASPPALAPCCPPAARPGP